MAKVEERDNPITSQPDANAVDGQGNGTPKEQLAENPLSEREMDVAQLLVTGASNNEIAHELVISPHTVKVHLRNIYEKLQVSSRTEASMLLLQQGWVTVPGVQVAVPVEKEEPPDPVPLADRPAKLADWQRIYLMAMLLVCVAAWLAPSLVYRVQVWPELLSDASLTILGQPTVADLPRWESRTPLPQPRDRFALVAGEGRLYAIGGETTQGEALTSVDAYDLAVNEWRPVASLPQPLANLAATRLNERLYVAGGSRRSSDGEGQEAISDALLAYDIRANAWTQLGQLPVPLAGAALVSAQDALYLIGGWDGQTMHDEVWRLAAVPAMATGEPLAWEVVTHLSTPRAFLGATTVDDRIYVAGGYDGHRELTAVAVYLLGSQEWQSLPSLSMPRGGLSLVYDGFALFALGGGWTRPIETQERYDPAMNLWSNFPSPITGEWRSMGAASENGRIYVVGGWARGYLSTHFQYQSLFNTFLPFTEQ